MLPLILAETETAAATMPSPFVYAAIAAAAFLIAGLVTYSYRDVANRHSDKTADQDAAGHGHH